MALRVVTANLFFGRVATSEVAAVVDRLAPDVLAVQELIPPIQEVLEARFMSGAVVREGSGLSIGLFLDRAATFERLPLVSYDAIKARLDDGLEIITTHLIAPHTLPPWKTYRRRIGDVAALTRYLSDNPGGARVLMGDLNSSPAWPLYRKLLQHLDDAPRMAAELDGGRPGRTWGPWPGSPRLFRIDHVLVSGVGVLGAEVADVAGSDHGAVVVDLDV